MIEAVKSTVASGVLLRANVDQSSTLNSFASNPEKIQSTSQAPYVSPTVRIDVNTKIAILEFREALSGEVLSQIPSEQALRSYRMRHPVDDAQETAQKSTGAQEGTASTHTAPVVETKPAVSQNASSSAGNQGVVNAAISGGAGSSSAVLQDATETQLSV